MMFRRSLRCGVIHMSSTVCTPSRSFVPQDDKFIIALFSYSHMPSPCSAGPALLLQYPGKNIACLSLHRGSGCGCAVAPVSHIHVRLPIQTSRRLPGHLPVYTLAFAHRSGIMLCTIPYRYRYWRQGCAGMLSVRVLHPAEKYAYPKKVSAYGGTVSSTRCHAAMPVCKIPKCI